MAELALASLLSALALMLGVPLALVSQAVSSGLVGVSYTHPLGAPCPLPSTVTDHDLLFTLG